MIIVQGADPLPNAELPPELIVKRIELFIIPEPAIAGDTGYKICMCITTNQGFGRSELFLQLTDLPADWSAWSAALSHYIGSISTIPFLWSTSPEDPNHLQRLFADSVTNVTVNRCCTEQLLHHSTFYLSLF